ncbi:MAG TPA: DegV family protein, partial [Coriobacteriia bacterium]|nr:DegV family protein [Coriobacteriia bacterium]
MSFAIVTDSTSDISAELAAERGIDVVPLSVTIGDETMLDDTLTQTEFFERMASAPRLPTTSQPSVGAFVEVYERALAKAEEVLSIHISSKLSGTFDSATQAAAQFAGRVHVFDSRNLSWGLSLQVLEATAAAAQGLGVAATLERLESARDRTKLIVGLDSLDNHAKGGRIGKVSAFLGAMLDLKVTLTVDSTGAFQPVARSRGEKA